MVLPTFSLSDIIPKFLLDNLFIVLLVGDVALSGFLSLATGSDFKGIFGTIIGFVLSFFAELIIGVPVVFIVPTWFLLLIVLFFQFGVFKLLLDLLQANHGNAISR